MKKYSDYKVLFLALGAAFVFVYFLPAIVCKILFFIFIYLFYKSEKDYLWMAFIFILIQGPGGLFSGGRVDEENIVPIYQVVAGISITFEQIFILTALFKTIKKKIDFNPFPFIKNNLLRLTIYFIFLIIVGIGIGSSFDAARYLYFVIINLTLFYSLYSLFTKESDYVNFFRMLIPFGFIVIGLQLYSTSTGEPLVKYFKPVLATGGVSGVYGEDVRPIDSSQLITFLFFFSMYFLLHKKRYFNKNLLLILNIVSLFSIILGATRSWFVMFVMFYILIFMFISGKSGKAVIRYGIAGTIAVLFLFSSDLFIKQFETSFRRISTLELVAEGDITGGGTVKRFDVRAPRLMEYFFNESTVIFGAGFSEVYHVKQDQHVGYQNLLFNTGIVGSILFALFLGSVIMNTFGINRKLSNVNPYKDIIKIFPIAIISMLFLNVGVQAIGYDVGLSFIFLMVFILYFLNNQISCAIKWEEENQ